MVVRIWISGSTPKRFSLSYTFTLDTLLFSFLTISHPCLTFQLTLSSTFLPWYVFLKRKRITLLLLFSHSDLARNRSVMRIGRELVWVLTFQKIIFFSIPRLVSGVPFESLLFSLFSMLECLGYLDQGHGLRKKRIQLIIWLSKETRLRLKRANSGWNMLG